MKIKLQSTLDFLGADELACGLIEVKTQRTPGCRHLGNWSTAAYHLAITTTTTPPTPHHRVSGRERASWGLDQAELTIPGWIGTMTTQMSVLGAS